jgi:hypothetical protein
LWNSIFGLYELKWVMPGKGSVALSKGSVVEDDPFLLNVVYLERKK